MRQVYSVSEVNRHIRNLFTGDGALQGIYVRGEVSNCKYHSSGHIYFSLKDEHGAISCVMFRGDRSGLSFRMKDGDRVVAGGRIDVFERDGRYQLYAREIQLEGEGLLFERFSRLKKKLEAEGLFDPSHKKPIPPYASVIGVVTAPTGAAVRDIQNISHRRNPYVQVILCPALVQGDGAAESVAEGIHTLDGHVDVLIVGRGGGSMEDLWAFNEEIVARAIYECGTPVISAVGHQTDTTIADYVSDRAAPTPSAAAELAVFDAGKFRQDLRHRQDLFDRAFRAKTDQMALKADWYEQKLRAMSPKTVLMKQQMHAAQLDRDFADLMAAILNSARRNAENLESSFNGVMPDLLQNAGNRADRLEEEMKAALSHTVEVKKHTFTVLLTKYEALNPLLRLRSGYAYAENDDRKSVRSVKDVNTGDAVRIFVTDGMIDTRVTGTHEGGFGSGNTF